MITTKVTRKKSGIIEWKSDLVKNKWLYILFLPALVWYILFAYWPMFGLVVAFEKYNVVKGIMGSKWVGLQNFKDIFSDIYFTQLLKNTFLLSLNSLIFGFPIPIVLALCFNEVRHMMFKKVAQTISYLPYFISTVIVCGLAITFLSPSTGIVNAIIGKFGFESTYFLQEPKYFRTIYVIVGVWQTMGFSAILYIAALAGISPELYEAAKIDGANRWKQLCYITFPSLIPTITIMLILSLGNMLNADFEKIILLYNPTIYETADVLNTYVYRKGLLDANYSYATAIGLFQGVVGFVLVLGANWLSKKANGTSLW
ncbi:sugar ABC transporter permease [Paenibacillus marchantiophytorum]|uniref:Sugar ABC transporter permease n=1 Tax=Paenibacillus marchantiophytorum TaxID=1619310 RepID=A0ABQ1ERH1_9BACL|nr:ABC transporter permease subunit [Paenibacillus marchantiophytorum]GFZ82770.1 sugar ABC transporter permease [Paenibacillus marchantiophytorum]